MLIDSRETQDVAESGLARGLRHGLKREALLRADDPGIHVFLLGSSKDVDGRDRPAKTEMKSPTEARLQQKPRTMPGLCAAGRGK